MTVPTASQVSVGRIRMLYKDSTKIWESSIIFDCGF